VPERGDLGARSNVGDQRSLHFKRKAIEDRRSVAETILKEFGLFYRLEQWSSHSTPL
jgi:hypothetical protein